MTLLAPTLEAFFTDRLVAQRGASPNTIAAYRDTFRLLLVFAKDRTGISPSKLVLEDLDATLVSSFLDALESERHVSVKTRNVRLSAVHSLYSFASLRHPEHAQLIQRVLSIPAKRALRPLVDYLSAEEIDALLAAPDQRSRTGRRDRALMAVTVQTGLRVSELVGLRRSDVSVGIGACVHCVGKGRKERSTPLGAATAKVLRSWMDECGGGLDAPVFPGPRGKPLSRDAIAKIVSHHATTAAVACPSIATKNVTPHVLRHSCAMRLLEAGVDVAVIALWLGHESVRTTDIYQHADLALKERALARVTPSRVPTGRFQPSDSLLAFLDSL